MPSREPELYKDKVEVSLDGRQIFYLFFGGAMIVGVVFVLGVLVGRRVEARGHIDRAHTQTATDPLAALDRLEGSGGLSFRGALTGKEQPTDVERAINERASDKAKPAKVEKPEVKAEVKVDSKVDAKVETKPDVKPKTEPVDGPVLKPEKDSESRTKTDGKAAGKVEAKLDTKVDGKVVASHDPKLDAKPDPSSSATEKSDAEKAKEAKQRFTLQLSSFQDKAEAEAFLSSVKAQGYQAQITQAEVEGKGTFYRVRMGTYRSLDAATSAKADFEKTSSKSASIMKL
jgi:cell division septation protein DedD